MIELAPQNIERVLLDMDGVLVNLVKGVCEFHEKPWPYQAGEQGNWQLAPLMGMTHPQMWGPLGHEFWANLEPMPNMQQFVMSLEAKFGVENICLLTSPIRTPGAIDGKMDWIRKHLPQYKRRFLIGPAKEFCASPTNVLIDDSEGNEIKFKRAGGHVFLVPAPWNRKYNEIRYYALTEWLDTI